MGFSKIVAMFVHTVKTPPYGKIWNLHKNVARGFEQILDSKPHKTAVVCPPDSYLPN